MTVSLVYLLRYEVGTSTNISNLTAKVTFSVNKLNTKARRRSLIWGATSIQFQIHTSHSSHIHIIIIIIIIIISSCPSSKWPLSKLLRVNIFRSILCLPTYKKCITIWNPLLTGWNNPFHISEDTTIHKELWYLSRYSAGLRVGRSEY
jgi:hypothetical protein